MASSPGELQWSSQFLVRPLREGRLPLGDKIQLPQSALEQLLAAAPIVTDESSTRNHASSAFDPFNQYTYAAERQARADAASRHQELPHPLTFRLVNPANGRVVFAGISEFSAAEGRMGLSAFLSHALGLDEDTAVPADEEKLDPVHITVHAKQLPKGTFVKLRPLESGYDPDDWKSLLEDHMRKNFTTLTRGEVLTVPSGRQHFQFLIDEMVPEGEGICVVDTDLEVDIEALNEEQALETLKHIAKKTAPAPDTTEGTSTGGILDLFRPEGGQVLPGHYVDYELPSWDRTSVLEIEVRPEREDLDIALFASPVSNRQRAKPRQDEHVFADFDGRPIKRLRLSPTNVELEGAEALRISVFAAPFAQDTKPRVYGIRARPHDASIASPETPSLNPTNVHADEVICNNCQQVVPKQTLVLHENFCLRNNVVCPHGCGKVFLKNSTLLKEHWHCPRDESHGDTPQQKEWHDAIYHTLLQCPACSLDAKSMPLLAQHRTSACPGKLILCRFCHLEVPQEGDPEDATQMAEASMTGLTPHELVDGGRTTECHLCGRITRLRDMDVHLKHHDHERKSRAVPRACRNVNCGRTVDGASANGDTNANRKKGQQDAGNDIGLCSACYAPLYVAMYDPDGKAIKRRVERRYLTQLLTGCGKSWCRNEFCKTGKMNGGVEAKAAATSTREALPMIKPLMEGLLDGSADMYFCTDEMAQQSRALARLLAAEGDERIGQKKYAAAWCVAALEAERGDAGRARQWLKNFAPALNE